MHSRAGGCDARSASYPRGMALYRIADPTRPCWSGPPDSGLMDVEREVEAAISDDPMVAVMLARALEAGQRASAERWYLQAPTLGRRMRWFSMRLASSGSSHRVISPARRIWQPTLISSLTVTGRGERGADG